MSWRLGMEQLIWLTRCTSRTWTLHCARALHLSIDSPDATCISICGQVSRTTRSGSTTSAGLRGDALQELVRQQSWQSSMCVGTTITACCSPNPTALPSSQLPGHCTTCLTRLVGITHFVVCSELFLHARASRLGPGKSPLPSGDSGVNTFLDLPVLASN